MRLSKKDYYLRIAEAISERSTCLRKKYGAIIIKNDEIIATGYNGSPRGYCNCCDSNKCWRKENKIPAGEQYEKCQSVHAEQNCIISASRQEMINSTMYLYGFDLEENKEITAIPCVICSKLITNSGITEVINIEGCLNNNYNLSAVEI